MTTTVTKIKTTCTECHETYILAWYEGGAEPTICPFCAFAINDIGNDDEDTEKEEDYSGD